jgi:hypothetical protein
MSLYRKNSRLSYTRNRPMIFLSLYIYIYICVCVCVCVCFASAYQEIIKIAR